MGLDLADWHLAWGTILPVAPGGFSPCQGEAGWGQGAAISGPVDPHLDPPPGRGRRRLGGLGKGVGRVVWLRLPEDYRVRLGARFLPVAPGGSSPARGRVGGGRGAAISGPFDPHLDPPPGRGRRRLRGLGKGISPVVQCKGAGFRALGTSSGSGCWPGRRRAGWRGGWWPGGRPSRPACARRPGSGWADARGRPR